LILLNTGLPGLLVADVVATRLAPMVTHDSAAPATDAQNAPHLLYIVWGYPPCRGGGVYRALATANHFAQNGWRVTVLTAERETFERYTGADSSLEQEIDPRVRVVRVPFHWPVHETDIGEYNAMRVYAPRIWRKLRSKRDLLAFPEEGYGPWRSILEQAVRRIHARTPVDLTIATANPNVTFAAARHLFERSGVPYVMDYRDAWLLNVFTGEQVHSDRSRAAHWERRLIADAREVWFVNEPIRSWHRSRYPDAAERMHVVANGWDPDLLNRGLDGPRTRTASTAPMVFGYLGTVSPNVPLAELVQGWISAKADGLVPPDAKLRIGGYLGYYAIPRSDMLIIVARGAEAGVEYVGPVPKLEVGAFYEGVDVLLLALGKGRYVTSGKVFEYIATGKPIVSVHHHENAASEILEGYPGWVLTEKVTPESIAQALGRGAGLATTDDPQIAAERAEFAADYRRDRQFLPRIKALREAAS
jgi:glycosyltransferase involved in cell wall biosynthesis